MRHIPFGKPMIGDAEREAMAEVLNGTILTHGPKCAEFEQSFAKYVGVKHAVTTSNCTTAIHLGLISCGVDHGDEVIVPAMTHVATAHAVEHCGALPVFVDINLDTGCVESTLIERHITKRTKAIVVVHFIGLPCDMTEVNRIAKKYQIPVIEDAATALGANFLDKKAGNLGTIGCFSFYPTKHITSLEGGMLVTNDDDIADQVRSQRAFGYDRGLAERNVPGIYDIKSLGWNYRMSEGHAAVGSVQLARLPEFLRLRKKNAENLADNLSSNGALQVLPFVNGCSHSSWYCVNILVSKKIGKSRDDVVKMLNSVGVGTSVHYPVALPLSKFYVQKYRAKSSNFPYANRLAKETISLPCGPHVSDHDVDFMIKQINEITQL